MASAKLVRDCSSELSSDVRSLSVASSTEEQESTTTESEYTEEEKEYELEDLQILKTIGKSHAQHDIKTNKLTLLLRSQKNTLSETYLILKEFILAVIFI